MRTVKPVEATKIEAPSEQPSSEQPGEGQPSSEEAENKSTSREGVVSTRSNVTFADSVVNASSALSSQGAVAVAPKQSTLSSEEDQAHNVSQQSEGLERQDSWNSLKETLGDIQRSVKDGVKERIETVKETINDFIPDVSPMNPKYTFREHVFIVFVAMVLSFNSAFSNGVSLSGFLAPPDALFDKQSTSGYTGVYTSSALALADTESRLFPDLPNVQYFGFQISMILAFMAGSMISALMNPRPTPWRLAPMYAPTFLIGAVFMIVAALMSAFESNSDHKNHFFFFVALANGVQNGISSMYTANLIRTTHLTGTSTDIGLFVGQLLRGNRKNSWKLKILSGLATSFWIGSLVSYYAVKVWRTYSLLFNAGIFLLVFLLIVVFLVKNLHLSVYRALRGTWHWQRTMHRLSLRSGVDGTPKPEETLLATFDKMDADKDGYITSDELYAGLKEAGMHNLSKKTVSTMFEVADRDQEGRISQNDWRDLVYGENVLVG